MHGPAAVGSPSAELQGGSAPTGSGAPAVQPMDSPHAVTAFFVLAFIVFTCVSPYIAAVNNPNENTRTYMTMAIVEDHTFRIDRIVTRHGWVNDMARVPDDSPAGAHLASVKGPATSYLGVPVYWVFTKVAPWFGHKVPTEQSSPPERVWWLRAATLTLRLFTVQLPCFAFLVLFERWLRATSRDVVFRLSAVAAAGLGTNFLAYGLMFVSHALFAVAAFGAFAVTLRERRRTGSDARARSALLAFAAGLLAGLATLLEYYALPLSIVLALYAAFTFWRPTRLLALAGGGLVDVVALLFYQKRACGHPILPCHRYTENFPWLHEKYFGLGKPDFGFMARMSFSRAFGFFGTSPFMWLGLLAIPFGFILVQGSKEERRERRVATSVWLVGMAALWITVSSVSNPHGGWSVGPRYLGAAPPFFAWGAVCALEAVSGASAARRQLCRATAGGLALASVLSTGLVSLVYNTLPESLSRPLAGFALPLARTGFVPHHAAELVGWMSPAFWYFVAACLVFATGVAVFWFLHEKPGVYAARAAGAVVVASLGLLPSFLGAKPEDKETDAGTRAFFAAIWEPPGRDFITKTREQAERYGNRRPCLWFRVADLERLVHQEAQAARDELRAAAPRSVCR